LEPGGIPHRRDHISEAEVWEFYKTLPQFNNVVESQFEVRLKDHRTKASEYLHQALQEEQYFARDQLIYPRQSHNERGESVFDLSPAKALLREQDISNGVHTIMSVARLQNFRVRYHPFKPKIFKDRVHQAVRLSKYISYLELKPTKLGAANRN
jgi:hypothetical protein